MKKLLPFLAAVVLAVSAQAQTESSWIQTATGNYTWFNAANWNNSTPPNSSGYAAMFNMTGYAFSGANVTIDVDQATTLHSLRVVNSGTGYLTLGNSTITMNATSGQIQVSPGISGVTINNNIVLGSATTSTGFNVTQTWFKGAISGSSNITVGGGYVFWGGNNTFSGNVALNGGEILATSTNAFSNASAGTYTLAAAGTTNLGTTAIGTTVFNNAINKNDTYN